MGGKLGKDVGEKLCPCVGVEVGAEVGITVAGGDVGETVGRPVKFSVELNITTHDPLIGYSVLMLRRKFGYVPPVPG